MYRKAIFTILAALSLSMTGCGALLADAAVAVPFAAAKGGVGLTFYTVGGAIELADKADEAAYKKAKRQAELQMLQAKAFAAVSALDAD